MPEIDSLLDVIAERAKTFAPLARTEVSNQQEAPEILTRPDPPEEELEAASVSDTRRAADPVRQADIAIIAALPSPELEQTLAAFGGTWKKEGREGVVYNLTESEVGGTAVSIVAAAQTDMGMVPAAILTTKTVSAWQPRLVAMVGVCAGVRERVNLGDVVVGRQVFDYGSGKLNDGRLMPDYQPVSLDEQVCAYAIDLASSSAALSEIRGSWPTTGGKPDTELRAHVGAMASGAAVIADDSMVVGIQQHKRSLLAIDMEAYGVMRAATSAIAPPLVLVVKGVQDFADATKNDDWREYAAFVSARFLARFLDEHWNALVA